MDLNHEDLVWLQDHVIAGVKMTLRGRFFSRAQYLQLVYQALQGTRVIVYSCTGYCVHIFRLLRTFDMCCENPQQVLCIYIKVNRLFVYI